MKRLIYLLTCSLFYAAPAFSQSGACAGSGVYVNVNDYVNYPRSSGGDIEIGSNGYLEIGPQGIYDCYGSVSNAGTIEVDSGGQLSIYGDMLLSGTLILHPGGTIRFYGKTWRNTPTSQVSDGRIGDTRPGGDLHFTGIRPLLPPDWLAASSCLALYSGGSSSQEQDGGAVPMDLVLHLDNHNNVVLINTATRIEGRLQWDIAGGHVILGDNDLVFSKNGTQDGFAPDRFAVTSGSGHVVKEQYTGNWIFPVGIAAGDYTPAAINNGTENTMHVLVQDYATSASDELLSGATADGMDRSWNIYADLASGNSNITLQHNTVTNQSLFDNSANFVTRWSTTTPNNTGDLSIPFSTSAWQNNIPAAGTTGNLSSTGTVAGSNMRSRVYTDFATSASDAIAYFTKSSDPTHPLPVELLQFTATAKQCGVDVNFSSGREGNIHKYYVQHSTNGRNFTTLAVLDPKGSNQHYSYHHTRPANGNNIYRLSLVEQDGTYTVSPSLSVWLDCPVNAPAVQMYPNPAVDYVHLSGIRAPAQVRIMNLHGRVMQAVVANEDNLSMDISQLPQATYLLQVIWEGRTWFSERLIKL